MIIRHWVIFHRTLSRLGIVISTLSANSSCSLWSLNVTTAFFAVRILTTIHSIFIIIILVLSEFSLIQNLATHFVASENSILLNLGKVLKLSLISFHSTIDRSKTRHKNVLVEELHKPSFTSNCNFELDESLPHIVVFNIFCNNFLPK